MAMTANQRGAAFMVVSQAAFMANDTLVKLASASLGIGQIMAVRGVFATLLIFILVWRLGDMRRLSEAARPAVFLRIAGEIGGTIFYLIALSNMPIANVQAVFQSLPLAITMTAALFLGESVGYRRWLAISAGFVGVMFIVRPGLEGFNAYSLYVLASVASCTIRDLATRHLPDTLPSSFISMLTATAVTICGWLLVVGGNGWKPLSSTELVTLCGAAILLLVGYQFIIQAMRVGDISFVAPFRYTALVWAIISGIIVFDTMPDAPMLIGSTIVILSGIYSLYRERRAGKSRPIAESTSSATSPDGV